MKDQFEYILQDIRNGATLPDRWPEDLEEDEEGEDEESAYTRWWEDPNDPDYAAYQRSQGGK